MEPDVKTVEIATKTTAVDLQAANDTIAQLRAELDTTKAALRDALKVIDDQNRARLCAVLKDVTNLSTEDMNKMTTDALEELVSAYRLLKKPIVGVKDIQPETRPNITIGSKFKFAR